MHIQGSSIKYDEARKGARVDGLMKDEASE